MGSHFTEIIKELFDQADDLILITTPCQKIEFMNKKAANLFRWDKSSPSHLRLDALTQQNWDKFSTEIQKNYKGSCLIKVHVSKEDTVEVELSSHYMPDQQLIFSRVVMPPVLSNGPLVVQQPMNQLIQSISYGVVLTTLKGQIITANAKALQLLNRELWQIEKRGHDYLFEEVNQDSYAVILYYRKLSNGENAVLNVSKVNERGHLNYYRIESVVDVTINSIITTIIDETEKVALIEKVTHQDSLQLIGQNMASIVHELRNPMASLHGFFQLLKESADVSHNHFFEIMESELQRMNLMLEELLNFSKPKLFKYERFCLLNVIQSTVDLMQPQAILKNTLIEFEYSKLGDYSLFGNEGYFKQMMINLVKNSIEAIEYNGKITLKLDKQVNGKMALIVADEGVGMDKQTVENLFNPFYTTKATGTGLGLMFVKKVVMEHGGDMMLCTDKGYGTQFKLVFNQSDNMLSNYVQGALVQPIESKFSYSS